MALYKRGKFWWIDFTDSDGGRIQRSLKTTVKEDAQQLHDKLVNDRWKVKELGKKQRRTWEETVVRWVTEKHLKKSLKTDISRFRYLNAYLGHRFLDEFNLDKINTIRGLAESFKTGWY